MEQYEEPRGKMLAVFEVQAESVAAPTFRGCAFVNASAEDPSGQSTAREVSLEMRRWLHDKFQMLARELGVAAPDDLGKQLSLLYDGATVAATLDRDLGAPARAHAMAEVLIDSHRRPRKR